MVQRLQTFVFSLEYTSVNFLFNFKKQATVRLIQGIQSIETS